MSRLRDPAPAAGHPREAPPRPPRPALVEAAAAVLIVSGALSIPATLTVMGQLADGGEDPSGLALLSVGLAVASIVLGILVRYGRAWLVALNVAAVAGFLELISGTPGGLVFGALDVFVVLALAATRPWFQVPPDAPDDEAP